MGYRIVEAYYRGAPDKSQAILDILSVTDYAMFLEKSGYAPLAGTGRERNRRSAFAKATADTLRVACQP